MLGATAMGAMAADLSNYPNMFVTDGTFNGYFVVGAEAAAVDNLAMTDIAASMKYMGTGSSTTTVEGDAFLIRSGSDVLEIGESVGPASAGVVDFLDSDNLGALADGEFKNSRGTFSFEQFLHFNNDQYENVTFVEDDDDVTDIFFYIKDNRNIARYQLDFIEAAESDIDSSDSYELDDYEGKTMTFLGKAYNIVKAVTGGANSNKVTLTLMAGSVTDTLLEGDSKTYTLGGVDYEVSLAFTDSSSRAKYIINGQTTSLLEEGETFTLSDDTVIGVSEVLYQDYAGGIHSSEFYLGADKLTMEDDNIAVESGTDDLKVNEETIDGARVIIKGTVSDNATSATEDGILEIDSIEVNMTAQEDLYVAPGEKLSEQAELEEKDLLFTRNIDFEYTGLADIPTHMIAVKDKSGEKEYQVTFTNVAGDDMTFPLVYASGATQRPGDQDNILRLNNSKIGDDEYFILNDDTDEDSVSHVVQYKGSNVGSDDTKVKFKVLATGESVTRILDTSNNQTTLKLSGTTYTVYCLQKGGNNCAADNFNLTITGGSDTSTKDIIGGNASLMNYVIAKGGAKIFIRDAFFNKTADQIHFNISLIDKDRVDDNFVTTPSADAPYVVYGANITAASSKVDLASKIGVTLKSPQEDTDQNLAYTKNGAYIKEVSPSGSGTTADTVEISWPEEERLPMLYVTSGAVAKSVTGGDMMRVEVVDATKLDSEVADVTAQNVIAVGGPCVNTVAAALMGNPGNCAEGFSPGKARIKMFDQAGGKVAMLVAGYGGADTRLAGKVIAHRAGDLSGEEVEVEGTTYSDATIGAPSVAVAAPAEEAAMEETAETTE